MDCSIIICTWNRATSLQRTMAALQGQDYPADRLEIIVVDNGSVDHTRDVVLGFEERAGIRVRYCVEPVSGLSRARNRGVARASGEIVVFVDDDAFPERSDWISNLLQAYSDPAVCAAGGDVRPVWPDGGRPEWVHDFFLAPLGLTELDLPAITARRYPYQVWGANISYRRECVLRHGGFSTDLGRRDGQLLSGEETALNVKLELAGRKVVYVPDAAVHHVMSEERLTMAWLLRRAHAQGIASAITDRQRVNPTWRALLLVGHVAHLAAHSAGAVLYGLLGSIGQRNVCLSLQRDQLLVLRHIRARDSNDGVRPGILPVRGKHRTMSMSEDLFRRAVRRMNDVGLEFWIERGTLLGLVRDGAVIPWDDDYDFGTWRNEATEAMIRQAFDTAEFRIRSLAERGIDGFHVLPVDDRGAGRVDIVIYAESGDRAVHRSRCIRTRPWTPFTLSLHRFLDPRLQADQWTKRLIEELFHRGIRRLPLQIGDRLVRQMSGHLDRCHERVDLSFEFPAALFKAFRTESFLGLRVPVPLHAEQSVRGAGYRPGAVVAGAGVQRRGGPGCRRRGAARAAARPGGAHSAASDPATPGPASPEHPGQRWRAADRAGARRPGRARGPRSGAADRSDARQPQLHLGGPARRFSRPGAWVVDYPLRSLARYRVEPLARAKWSTRRRQPAVGWSRQHMPAAGAALFPVAPVRGALRCRGRDLASSLNRPTIDVSSSAWLDSSSAALEDSSCSAAIAARADQFFADEETSLSLPDEPNTSVSIENSMSTGPRPSPKYHTSWQRSPQSPSSRSSTRQACRVPAGTVTRWRDVR